MKSLPPKKFIIKYLFYIFSFIVFHSFVLADSELELKINRQDWDGRTVLHYTTISIYQKPYLLFNKRFTPSIKDKDGRATSPFVLVPEAAFETIHQQLIMGADPDIQDKWGETPLFYLAGTGNVPLFHLLLGKSANLDIQNKFGNTLLHIASNAGHLELVHFLLDKKSTLQYQMVNVAKQQIKKWLKTLQWPLTNTEELLLHLSNRNNEVKKLTWSPPAINMFLQYKEANPFIKNNFGKMPIHAAAYKEHLKIVRLFIEKGVNPDIQDDFGDTLLHIASNEGHLDLVYFLLDKKSVHWQDSTLQIEIELDEMYKHLNIPWTTVKEANPYIKNRFGKMPIHAAAYKGHLHIVRLFIEKNVYLDIQDDFGNTLLHIATNEGHLDLVYFLLEKGANPDIENQNKKTPLDIAKAKNNRAIVTQNNKKILVLLQTKKCRKSFK